MPNVPMADLSLAMQLNNTMALGQNATFTLVASNKGPSPETGPTVVMTTLSPGLTYTSMSGGSSWACAPAGQVVTCKYTGSIAAGASLPPLTLNAKVTATGKLTVSATVSGAMYDPDLGNNTAIIERTISEGATYFFTDKACNLNVVVDTPGECSTTLAPIVAGEARDIYVTHVADGKTVAPGTAIQAMTFALRCLNPETNAGIKASYAGQVLPVCAENDTVPAAWSSLSNITFVGASSKLSFKYLDVGKVQLLLRLGATGKVGESSAFVSIPHEVRIFAIKGNTGVAAPVNPQDADLFTIAAGVEFSVSAGAFSKDGTLTPNFGRELIDGAGFAVPAVSIGASTSAGIAAMTHDEDNAHDEVAYVLPALRGSFPSPQGGASTGLFMWDDVGIINLTPGIASMTYHGVNLSPTLLITPQKAGRFIPHHFKTETTQRMLCTPKMTCPPGVGAAYSRENFDVTVTARSKSGAQTMNYRGAFAREVVLSAWSKAGASLAAEQKSGLSKTSAKASDFNDGVATVAPSYTLLNPFVHTSPQGPWGAPESIFLRAVEAGGGVTSNVEDPLEAGIRIVNGRLFVPSAHGSERLNLPLQLSAQYWSGSNWEVSSNDKHTLIDPDPAKVAFTKLVGLSNTTLSLLPSTAQLLTLGVAKYAVKAPGQTGTAELLMDQMIWLPSTKGRIKFGTYKSPLIYLRELH